MIRGLPMTAISTWAAMTAAALALAGCSRDARPSAGNSDAGPDAAPIDRPADASALDGPVETAAPDTPATCIGCLPLEACWNGQLCVARSVAVPAGFSIDATEVTRRQYAVWLATTPSTGGQDSRCAWNDRFTPDAACMGKPSVCQDEGCSQHPQPCVDMCDAAAYCRAVGKRLCGAFAGRPPVTTFSSRNSARESQWFNACSSNGTQSITYGNERATGNCNDFLAFPTTTVPVGSKPNCQSPVDGYRGIFDLIGNVAEWEDNLLRLPRRDGKLLAARISFGFGAAVPTCGSDDFALRSDTRDNLGFRCCSI